MPLMASPAPLAIRSDTSGTHDLEVLAVGLLVAHAELHGLGERVHHVEAVVVEDQHVGAGVEHRRQILAEVAGAHRGADRRQGLPAESFGGRSIIDSSWVQPQV